MPSPASSPSASDESSPPVPFQRKWSREAGWGDAAVSVVSSNVLAQTYIRTGKHFPGTDGELMKWKNRQDNLIEFLRNIFIPTDYSPDILCLQEVDNFPDFWNEQLLMLGYNAIQYKKRTVVRGMKSDGCVIAFKKSRFQLVAEHHFEFNELNNIARLHTIVANSKQISPPPIALSPESESRPSPSSSPSPESPSSSPPEKKKKKQDYAPYLLRDCIAAVSVLKINNSVEDKRDQEKEKNLSVVVSAHLFWNPACTDIKIMQAVYLLKHVNEVCKKYENKISAVILAGDLNSMPDSAVFSILTTGKLDKNHKDCSYVSDELFIYLNNVLDACTTFPFLHSVYQFPDYDANVDTDDALISTMTENFYGVLDHIFVHTSKKNENAMVVSRLELPSIKDCKRSKIRAFPAKECPSDHLPIAAVFNMDVYLRNAQFTSTTLIINFGCLSSKEAPSIMFTIFD